MMDKMYPNWNIEYRYNQWIATRDSYDGAPDSKEPLFVGNTITEATSQIDEYERNVK